MKKRLLYFLFAVLLFSACTEKEVPPDSTDELVFSMTGNIDNVVKSIYAGKNDFYMSTDYSLDSQGVYVFSGDLKQNCTNCKQSFRILIRNYKQAGSSGDYDPAEAFNKDQYRYYFDGPSLLLYKVSFKATPTGTGTVSHAWDFGDGTTSALANPVKEFSATQQYDITYTASFSSGCSSTLSYPLNLASPTAGLNNTGFGYTYLDDNTISLFTDNNSQVLWDLGNGIFSTQTSVTLQLDSGVQKVILKRITGTDTTTTAKNIPSRNYLLCNANFNQFILPVSDPLNLSTVIIEWTDEQGHTYSSSKVKQATGQRFRILSSSDYLTNEQGQKTRKLSIAFSCLLSDGTKTISLDNMQGTIAVAYP